MAIDSCSPRCAESDSDRLMRLLPPVHPLDVGYCRPGAVGLERQGLRPEHALDGHVVSLGVVRGGGVPRPQEPGALCQNSDPGRLDEPPAGLEPFFAMKRDRSDQSAGPGSPAQALPEENTLPGVAVRGVQNSHVGLDLGLQGQEVGADDGCPGAPVPKLREHPGVDFDGNHPGPVGSQSPLACGRVQNDVVVLDPAPVEEAEGHLGRGEPLTQVVGAHLGSLEQRQQEVGGNGAPFCDPVQVRDPGLGSLLPSRHRGYGDFEGFSDLGQGLAFFRAGLFEPVGKCHGEKVPNTLRSRKRESRVWRP